METSIPEAGWKVNANDPMALTRLLDLPDMNVTRIEYDDRLDVLIVSLEHDLDLALCPTCGQLCPHPHQYQTRLVRDLPVWGKICLLEFQARRFDCVSCQVPFTETLDWLPTRSRLTGRYRQHLFEACRQTSLQAVSRKEGVGYKTLQRLYYDLAEQEVAASAPQEVRLLGIDEFAVLKGHDQFALALSDLERGRILAVLPDRTKETLEAYLATWTPAQRAAVTEVAVDLWEPYAQAVRACLPNARVVADRFHVMKNLNDQVTSARRDIQRTAPEAAKETLKGCRWLLVRNEADLSETEVSRLEAMFLVAPELASLHRLKEDFRLIFERGKDREAARVDLQEWIDRAQASGLGKLNKFVKTLRRRLEDILNYFPNGLSSGTVEGLNNKIKVIKRCAYGYRNFEHFCLRVRVECDGTT